MNEENLNEQAVMTADAESSATQTPEQVEESARHFRICFDMLKSEVQRIIVGQDDIITHCITAMIAGGHVLLEGVPGLGKTMLVRSISEALELTFQRIQFTPDLMPADLIGTNILVDGPDGSSSFQFNPGPIFCNLLLGDEINRATPKTQSALLEAMQEKTVTVAGATRELDQPFFVLATQNPLEMEGTYPLPEAQLDRFFFKLKVPYPTATQFEQILDRTTETEPDPIQMVFSGHDLVNMGAFARAVPVAPPIRERAVQIIMATHPETERATEKVKKYVRYGASPRAGQALLLAAKIHALREGRFHVATEDLLAYVYATLRHRVMMSFEAQADGIEIEEILDDAVGHLKSGWGD
ncbi:MAG: AAA family ATPase [Verrucomicrobiota bacterium]